MDIEEKENVGFGDNELGNNREKIVASLVDEETFASHPANLSWSQAQNIMNTVRPIPWVVWVIGRSVFGHGARLGNPDYTVFANFDYLLTSTAFEGPFLEEFGNQLTPNADFEEIVGAFGPDVCAALCIIHAAVRCVKAELPISLWHPMIDDALIRVRLGFKLGQYASEFGSGRAMLAGFAGRIGATIQFIYGNKSQAEKALEQLAMGSEFQQVGIDIYGCDPLQVSALLLLNAGVSKHAAYGIASYTNKSALGDEPHTRQWYSAFSIIEKLRVEQGEDITEEEWQALDIGFNERQIISSQCESLIVSGHNLDVVFMEGVKT